VTLAECAWAFLNNQLAWIELGQPDWTSTGTSSAGDGLNFPRGVAFDPLNKRLFVADSGNNRIMVFDLIAGATNHMMATYVLGQSTWGQTAASLSQTGLSNPRGLSYDPTGKHLFVADTGNNRVL